MFSLRTEKDVTTKYWIIRVRFSRDQLHFFFSIYKDIWRQFNLLNIFMFNISRSSFFFFCVFFFSSSYSPLVHNDQSRRNNSVFFFVCCCCCLLITTPSPPRSPHQSPTACFYSTSRLQLRSCCGCSQQLQSTGRMSCLAPELS